MELLLNGESSERKPSADFLLRWFGEEHDPADFLILRDPALGELRAAAPQDGICLIRAEGAGPIAVFDGEAELPLAEAARVFVQFLSGDCAFLGAFESGSEAPSFTWVGWIVGALTTGAVWWSWRLL